MNPAQNIVVWGNGVPWADRRQAEQDLAIASALVEIFSTGMLRNALRFRVGTALNKVHFPAPLRYSEDNDLVRTSAGPIGPILDWLRAILEPWLGRAKFDQSPVAPKFRFRGEAEDRSGAPVRLKIEINTREIQAFYDPAWLPLTVPGFRDWRQFRHSLAWKCRRPSCALLQRDKGRDLHDLAYALEIFEDLKVNRIVEIFRRYLSFSDQVISRAQAQERMFAWLANRRFLLDVRPLLSASQAEDLTEDAAANSFRRVFTILVNRLPVQPWVWMSAMKERYGVTC